jgi:hypothetical protein
MNHAVTIERTGRRSYLVGNTYDVRLKIKEAGGHWDNDRRAWWMSNHDVAAQIAEFATAALSMKAAVVAEVADEEFVAIEGKTFDIKDKLRAMGGRWDGARKVWMVPASRAEAARALVPVATPRKAPTGSTFRSAPTRRFGWRPCGYPGCSPNYCDECDGEGYRPGR